MADEVIAVEELRSSSIAVAPRPWTTGIACLAMLVIFVGVHLDFSPLGPVVGGFRLATLQASVSAESMSRLGYRNAFQIWSGSWWALVTTAFLHTALWHIALNLYWMWRLGRPIEQAIGSLRLGLFLLFAAFISSATQLAMFDNVGIGASGMVYALVGFGWQARQRYPSLKIILTKKIGVSFLFWLVFCWVSLGRLIGNGAHLGGLLFGAVVAEAFVTGRWPRLAKGGVALFVLSGLTVYLMWPWSPTWCSAAGDWFQNEGEIEAAVTAYQTSLRERPNQVGVLKKLIHAERSAGHQSGACEAAELLARLAPDDPDAHAVSACGATASGKKQLQSPGQSGPPTASDAQ